MENIEKEKQIEEMTEIICDARQKSVYSVEIAEALYNAGYRKQSKGEWEEYNNPNIMCCSLCGWSTSHKNPREYKFCPNCGAHMKGE